MNKIKKKKEMVKCAGHPWLMPISYSGGRYQEDHGSGQPEEIVHETIS
jgi:hypothetical protein